VRGLEGVVDHISRLPSGGARFEIAANGCTWRVDVDRNGDTEIVSNWRDGHLADLDTPDWLGDGTARPAHS